MIDVDPETLSRLVASIYESAYDQSNWNVVVASLCNLFQGSRACLARIGPHIEANDSFATNVDPAFQRRYIEEHADQPNVFADAMFAAPIGNVYNDHRLVGGDRLKRSRFWNDWMAPQDMYGGIGSKILASGSSVWFFDIQRGRGQAAFEENDAELLQVLVPHLARATDISRKLKSMQTLSSAFSGLPFGVVLVDGYMQIRAANPAAEAIFADPLAALSSKSGQLVVKDPETMAALQNLVVPACGIRHGAPGLGGDLLIRSELRNGGTDLSLSVGPLAKIDAESDPFQERCAVIFINEIVRGLPSGFEEQVRSLFGLTVREASLAASLASGRSIKQTAEDSHVAYSTLRSHLDSVFRKTGTHQQSELVALLRSLQPPMRR